MRENREAGGKSWKLLLILPLWIFFSFFLLFFPLLFCVNNNVRVSISAFIITSLLPFSFFFNRITVVA